MQKQFIQYVSRNDKKAPYNMSSYDDNAMWGTDWNLTGK